MVIFQFILHTHTYYLNPLWSKVFCLIHKGYKHIIKFLRLDFDITNRPLTSKNTFSQYTVLSQNFLDN